MSAKGDEKDDNEEEKSETTPFKKSTKKDKDKDKDKEKKRRNDTVSEKTQKKPPKDSKLREMRKSRSIDDLSVNVYDNKRIAKDYEALRAEKEAIEMRLD